MHRLSPRWLALNLFFASACGPIGLQQGAQSTPDGSTSGTGDAGSTPGVFTLLFRDDFDRLDLTRWQVMTHSFDGNLALFSAQSPTISDGQLVLRLLPAPAGTVDPSNVPKSFLGAEVRSLQTLTYGRVRARIKFARGSAVVSSLVTLYTPWPADDWNELDIETLGRDPSSTQFNTQIYTGPPMQKPVTQAVSPTQNPRLETLGFDAGSDFHVYTIEWTPVSARFLVDEQQQYVWTQNIALMKLPQNVLLTIWASSSAAWAGPVVDDTSNAAITYDWVEVYKYSAE
jgi:beta-glucanase (GH16 family)